MKPEEIKIGGVYDVRVKVIKKNPGNMLGKLEIGAYTVDRATNLPIENEMSWFLAEESPAFVEITPENGVKNSEPAPKYDPNRLFRKGDRVQVKSRNGRCNGKYGEYLREAYCLVAEDEEKNELVRVFHNSSEYRLDPAYLELVTPVEELERYVIIHNEREKFYDVAWKDDDEPDGRTGRTRCRATYWYNIPPQTYTQTEAKAAASAECARLNAEHRKDTEQ